MTHYDMLVIGSGPAGQKAAKIGMRAGSAERKKVAGGICINSGST
jgi:NAD(P) transhydrogenase